MTDHNLIARHQTADGFSWNTHCLLTRYALRSCHVDDLDEAVPVVRLEGLLSALGKRLHDLISWYWGLVSRKSGTVTPASRPPATISSASDFLRALKLNPAIEIPYCRALTAPEVPAGLAHDPSRQGPPRNCYTVTADGEKISGREILAVFSDEPDWGMDQDLFAIASYGYGLPPFGPETGKSSQASFHMAFFHENPLVMALFPQVSETFLDLRVRLFFALARLAGESETPYWSFRFRAWAMHYLQDLTQPYHAKSLPFPVWVLLRRLARTPGLHTFVRRNKNLLMNRHHLFEAVVHFLLNEAARSSSDHLWFNALQGDEQPSEECLSRTAAVSGQGIACRNHDEGGFMGETVSRCDSESRRSGSTPAERLYRTMVEASAIAANMAGKLNRSFELLVNDSRLHDPEYFVGDDVTYPLVETVDRARSQSPDFFERFLKDISICFAEAGKVTRYAAVRPLESSR